MSIFTRFTNNIEARINQFADIFEDPKANLDYSLSRLEDSRAHIYQSLIRVSSAKKNLENQSQQLKATTDKTGQQAQAAMQAGREDLARTALVRKHDASVRIEELDTNIQNLDKQVDQLKNSLAILDHKIALFQAKKEELKAIFDSSQAQLQIRETLSGISSNLNDVGNTIRLAEERIHEMQARAQAIENLVSEGVLPEGLIASHDQIDQELYLIKRDQEINQELQQLKGTQTTNQ